MATLSSLKTAFLQANPLPSDYDPKKVKKGQPLPAIKIARMEAELTAEQKKTAEEIAETYHESADALRYVVALLPKPAKKGFPNIKQQVETIAAKLKGNKQKQFLALWEEAMAE